MASFLIRFQLHLADIFAGSFSRILPLGEKEKKEGGKKKYRPLRETVPKLLSFLDSRFISNLPPQSFSFRRLSAFALPTAIRRSKFIGIFCFSPSFSFFFFFVSLSTVDFQLFRVNAVATGHHASRRQSLDIRPDLSNSAVISICYEVDSTG